MTAGPRGPTAGRTVEMLAALLMEGEEANLQGIGARHEAYYWKLAAWLLPRLAPVSPGAPPAARRALDTVLIARALTDATLMYQEVRELLGVRAGITIHDLAERESRVREADAALRAALAAAPDGPAP